MRRSARIVLLKGIDENGFTFFTNYQSRKGKDLAADPRAALVFWWPELERQVRIEGTVSLTSAEESDEYFNVRPIESRIGAAVSPQSEPIESRETLETSFDRGAPLIPTASFPDRRTGAAIAFTRRDSNSGRAGRAGCMIGSNTSSNPAEVGFVGDWPRKPAIARSGKNQPRRREGKREGIQFKSVAGFLVSKRAISLFFFAASFAPSRFAVGFDSHIFIRLR